MQYYFTPSSFAPPPYAFPVNVGPDAEDNPWLPTCLMLGDLTALCKAASKSGPNLPFFMQVLEQWGSELRTPFDWFSILKACLSPGQFVQWKAIYNMEADSQARTTFQ